MKKFWAINFVLLSVFIADRIIKYYFYKNPVIIFGGDFFYDQLSFHFAKNYGVAFGLPISSSFLLGLIFFILIFLVSLLHTQIVKKNYALVFSITLIIIGAFSNLIDRIKYGFVIDYIDLNWFTIFNLADCLITLGVFSFLYFSYIKKD